MSEETEKRIGEVTREIIFSEMLRCWKEGNGIRIYPCESWIEVMIEVVPLKWDFISGAN